MGIYVEGSVRCLKLPHAFGELTFLGNQRRLGLLGLQEKVHEFEAHRLELGRIAHVQDALGEFKRRLGSA